MVRQQMAPEQALKRIEEKHRERHPQHPDASEDVVKLARALTAANQMLREFGHTAAAKAGERVLSEVAGGGE